jgi:hypothetical protein
LPLPGGQPIDGEGLLPLLRRVGGLTASYPVIMTAFSGNCAILARTLRETKNRDAQHPDRLKATSELLKKARANGGRAK